MAEAVRTELLDDVGAGDSGEREGEDGAGAERDDERTKTHESPPRAGRRRRRLPARRPPGEPSRQSSGAVRSGDEGRAGRASRGSRDRTEAGVARRQPREVAIAGRAGLGRRSRRAAAILATRVAWPQSSRATERREDERDGREDDQRRDGVARSTAARDPGAARRARPARGSPGRRRGPQSRARATARCAATMREVAAGVERWDAGPRSARAPGRGATATASRASPSIPRSAETASTTVTVDVQRLSWPVATRTARYCEPYAARNARSWTSTSDAGASAAITSGTRPRRGFMAGQYARAREMRPRPGQRHAPPCRTGGGPGSRAIR